LAVWVGINNLNCRQCNKQLKKIRGCEQEVKPKVIEGVEITRCPVKLITQETKTYLELFNYYQDGWLPVAGGILDQSMKVMNIFKFIQGEIERLEEKYGK
jgi:hypothetical protein